MPMWRHILYYFLLSFFLSSCLPNCGLPGVTRCRRYILTPSVRGLVPVLWRWEDLLGG